MDLIIWAANITFVNWISISVMLSILIICAILIIYYRKKVKRLDGLIGIISPDQENNENEDEVDLEIT